MKLRVAKAAVFLISLAYCCILYLTGRSDPDNLPSENADRAVNVDNVVHSRRITALQMSYLRDDYFDKLTQESSERGQRMDNEYKDDKNDDNFGRDATLDDVFISVKTSGKFHRTRLQVILDTWYNTAKRQTYFFTDKDDQEYSRLTGGKLINTGCGDSHTRHDLACKMGEEYDAFVASKKKWWCHFDDDNYVNTKRLVEMLAGYDWREDMYIGRASLNHPFRSFYNNSKVEFWFATGGAGICVSNALAFKMTPWCSNGRLEETSSRLRAPDDCTLGFVINNLLNVKLTRSNLLHSHLEVLGELPKATLMEQVSLSYRLHGDTSNLIPLDRRYNASADATKFVALHCSLAPTAEICQPQS